MPQDATQVRVGPGRLYYAPLGSPLPTGVADAWPSAWKEVGYTDEGSTFTLGREAEDVEVEEEFLPVRTTTVKHTAVVAFAAAQMTAANLKLALAGGTIDTAGAFTKYSPPAPGDEEQVMLGWDADDDLERWVFRKCFASGESELRNRKNADGKRIIPVEFNVEAVGEGTDPWEARFDDSLAA